MLFLILLVGLFFRTYQLVERFEFAHDADLYSWIVKDIAIDHHLRLIGQLTSAPGIFIGPFFYYSLIPFFVLTNMDPVGSLIPTTLLGLFTILSYYIVLSKLFNKETGLIAACLYATLITTINLDRWVVPTITTSIWSIWYFYCVVMIARRKFSVLPLLGILIGLIWHIHIALLPCLIALPISLLVAKKAPSKKWSLSFLSTLIITSLPLIFFEIRHNFQQSIALIANFIDPHSGPLGYKKLLLVLNMVTQNVNTLFFSPQSFTFTQNPIFIVLILLSVLLIVNKSNFSFKEVLPLYAWLIGIILFFSLSSSPISEYYFSNLNVIFIAFVSLLLASLARKNNKLFYIVSCMLIFIALKNIYFFVTFDIYHKGYLEKKIIVSLIKKDALVKKYPCVGITYITAPGENVGFRYLFYINKMRLTHPSLNVPVYNIVIPDELSKKEVEIKSGHIGLILPKDDFKPESLQKICSEENTNLTDSMFGFVK